MEDNDILTETIFLIKEESLLKDPSLFSSLVNQINHLILHDFEKLISLLYRIDVNEMRLKELLEKNTTSDAADLIATLIIDRQLEKIKSRQKYRRDNNNITEEDLL